VFESRINLTKVDFVVFLYKFKFKPIYMKILASVLKDFKRFFNLKTKKGLVRALVLALTIAIVAYFATSSDNKTQDDAPEAPLPTVRVALVNDIGAQSNLSLIGAVRAVSEAQIQAEAGGRVTNVYVTLGQQVSAGQILAQTENASQRAVLLQAEGAYESALVAAQSSTISIIEAENNLRSEQNSALATYRSAYLTVSNGLYNTLDDFFGNPNFSTPGVRIGSGSNVSYLNNERVAFNQILENWEMKKNTLTTEDEIISELETALEYVTRLAKMNNTFILEIEDEDSQASLNGAPLSTYAVTLAALQGTLNASRSSVENAIAGLKNTQEALLRAELASINKELSSSNAQVKQALGSLRGAQASLNKTIMRSPIAGEVNSLSIKTGDFVSAFTQVAEIANNNALEISTTVNEKDSTRISVGQIVTIEGDIEGVITAIAPALDNVTKKIEVKIATESSELINGDTVNISVRDTDAVVKSSGPLLIPITAIKFSDVNGTVFTVADNRLVSHDVVLGAIQGSSVEIIEGLTADMKIVVDARGYVEGQEVEAVNVN